MQSVDDSKEHIIWSHPSVLKISKGRDPRVIITDIARSVVLDALQEGWGGPPFDPFKLAEMRKINIAARDDIADARIIQSGKNKLTIEYNPNRPNARIRYSIAHEIAHSLFPDCAEQARLRISKSEMDKEDWQLEMLCNIAASELLMPIGSFADLGEQSLSIDNLMELRKKHEVSAEALLLRFVHLTSEPCLMFCASRRPKTPTKDRYRIDYSRPSRSLGRFIEPNFILPHDSVVGECTGIGYTAKGDETWREDIGELHIECTGIPPYPDHVYPRVVGCGSTKKRIDYTINKAKYLTGDATAPRGTGPHIIAHVVNDRGRTWGAGFGFYVRKKWPDVQKEFRSWATSNPRSFKLGKSKITEIFPDLWLFSMIVQKGYGESDRPRIRYSALEMCLAKLAHEALSKKATIHMPRIGSGQAGGDWNIIGEMIEERLCFKGIKVLIYDLPK